MLVKLGRRLNIRQIALATAEVYLTRFLTKVSLKEINLYLLVTTCLYVACKIEECPQHIRVITSEARNLWPEYIPQDITKVAEFEFYLIEEMDLYLVIHHPYKSLLQLRDFFTQQYMGGGFILTNEELQNSWSIINDSYITDAHLLFPPHVIAITAVYITVVLNQQNKHGNDGVGVGSTGSGNSAGSHQTSISNDKADIQLDDLLSLTYSLPNDNSDNGSNNGNNNGNNSNNGDRAPKGGEMNSGASGAASGMDHLVRIDQFREFLARSHINLDEVVEVLQDMVNLYAIWNRYNESQVKRALSFQLLNR